MLALMLMNCDMGEGLGNDALLMPYLDLANIACAAHAGDQESIRSCIALAQQHEVQIGVHIGFADRAHFGRREIQLSDTDLYDLCVQQIQLMQRLCDEMGAKLEHVKAHGALYNMMMRDDALLGVLLRAASDLMPGAQFLIMAVPNQSRYQAMAAHYKLRLVHEAFVDRAYMANGLLCPRSQSGACHEDIGLIMQQAESIMQKQAVTALGGESIKVAAQTVCIHGDSLLALESAQQLRDLLR